MVKNQNLPLEKITIALADDHEIFLDGLNMMLEKIPEFTIIGQAKNGEELIELVENNHPDVILTDIQMPKMDGIEATRNLIAKNPLTKIIALSMFDEDNMIAEMIEAGAKGYLLKNADKKEIIFAIHTVHNNHSYYCETASVRLLRLIARNRKQNLADLKEFTIREMEIIKMVCKQKTAQQIADELFISKRTVDGYKQKIEDKMEVKNTAGLVVYALSHKLITEEELFN